MNLYDIIKCPVFSKKSDSLLKHRKITIKTHACIKKIYVKKSLEYIFNIKVHLKGIKAINIRGKTKRMGNKSGKQKNEKKFIINISQQFDIDKILAGKINK